MEKTIQLDQRELQMAQAIDQELLQAWAQIGVLSEQKQQADRAKEAAIKKQEGLLRDALSARGITSYNAARPGPNGTIVVAMPDAIETAPPVEAAKPNGVIQPEIVS